MHTLRDIEGLSRWSIAVSSYRFRLTPWGESGRAWPRFRLPGRLGVRTSAAVGRDASEAMGDARSMNVRIGEASSVVAWHDRVTCADEGPAARWLWRRRRRGGRRDCAWLYVQPSQKRWVVGCRSCGACVE